MSFSTRSTVGFTLLEMLVVLLLVSMLSGLLMQGFIYMSGIYGAVKRQEELTQSQLLLNGWFRTSVQGLVNGMDGDYSASSVFEGDADFFQGVSFQPLMGQDQPEIRNSSLPHRIEWRLRLGEDGLQLLYGEGLMNQSEMQWFTISEWGTEQGRIQYWSDGEWYEQFPPPESIFEPGAPVMPDGIAVSVGDSRGRFDYFVALKSSPIAYQRPSFASGIADE